MYDRGETDLLERRVEPGDFEEFWKQDRIAQTWFQNQLEII